MNYSIQKIYNKGSLAVNEDEILIKDNVFGVFDGMSSLVSFKNKEGKTGGRLAAEIAKQAFAVNGRPLKELAVIVNQKIQDEMNKEGIDLQRKTALWSTMAAVVRLKRRKADFFQIGDSLIMAIYRDGRYKLLADYHDHDLENMILWQELATERVRNIWDKIKPQLVKNREKANINYGCLNGEETAINFFNWGEIGLKDVKSLILFTDGLIIPKENPRVSEDWPSFVEIYQKIGLKGLLKHVRLREKEDPNCWKYPRYKPHDDIAAIGIDFL